MKVFVHIDASGTYLGNGGFLMLTNLANELANMGYDVSVFDSQDRLKWKMFDWLSLKQINFEIESVSEILRANPKDYRLITSWLKAVPMHLRNESLRIWDQSELLRVGKDRERQYVLKHCDKIAVHNKLLRYYHNLGFHNLIILENWIRKDVYYDREIKRHGTVGIQLERDKKSRLLKVLFRLGLKHQWYYAHDFRRYEALKKYDLMRCNGPYGKVIKNMMETDFFVHNPQPSPYLNIFKGETLPLPLLEAMACGCVCIAKEHEGIKFSRKIIPLVDTMEQASEMLKHLMRNLDEKEEIRKRSVAFIEKNYRFDDTRRDAVKRWLE